MESYVAILSDDFIEWDANPTGPLELKNVVSANVNQAGHLATLMRTPIRGHTCTSPRTQQFGGQNFFDKNWGDLCKLCEVSPSSLAARNAC